MNVQCPSCRSTRVTDGSSRLITVLGIIAVGVGLFVFFGLCFPHPVDDWSHYVAFQDRDVLSLPLIALGIILVIGGSAHPDTLYCEACGYKWERTSRPKIQLRPTSGPHKH